MKKIKAAECFDDFLTLVRHRIVHFATLFRCQLFLKVLHSKSLNIYGMLKLVDYASVKCKKFYGIKAPFTHRKIFLGQAIFLCLVSSHAQLMGSRQKKFSSV